MIFAAADLGKIPMAVILERLSIRIANVASIANELEEGSTVTSAPFDTPELITTLQNIDYLRQALDDLTVLTTDLAQAGNQGKISFVAAARIVGKLSLYSSKSVLKTDLDSSCCLQSRDSTGEPQIF
ncbi:MAG: hypothetical protein WBB25_09065 [Sulfitobacter sp.]